MSNLFNCRRALFVFTALLTSNVPVIASGAGVGERVTSLFADSSLSFPKFNIENVATGVGIASPALIYAGEKLAGKFTSDRAKRIAKKLGGMRKGAGAVSAFALGYAASKVMGESAKSLIPYLAGGTVAAAGAGQLIGRGKLSRVGLSTEGRKETGAYTAYLVSAFQVGMAVGLKRVAVGADREREAARVAAEEAARVEAQNAETRARDEERARYDAAMAHARSLTDPAAIAARRAADDAERAERLAKQEEESAKRRAEQEAVRREAAEKRNAELQQEEDERAARRAREEEEARVKREAQEKEFQEQMNTLRMKNALLNADQAFELDALVASEARRSVAPEELREQRVDESEESYGMERAWVEKYNRRMRIVDELGATALNRRGQEFLTAIEDAPVIVQSRVLATPGDARKYILRSNGGPLDETAERIFSRLDEKDQDLKDIEAARLLTRKDISANPGGWEWRAFQNVADPAEIERIEKQKATELFKNNLKKVKHHRAAINALNDTYGLTPAYEADKGLRLDRSREVEPQEVRDLMNKAIKVRKLHKSQEKPFLNGYHSNGLSDFDRFIKFRRSVKKASPTPADTYRLRYLYKKASDALGKTLENKKPHEKKIAAEAEKHRRAMSVGTPSVAVVAGSGGNV